MARINSKKQGSGTLCVDHAPLFRDKLVVLEAFSGILVAVPDALSPVMAIIVSKRHTFRRPFFHVGDTGYVFETRFGRAGREWRTAPASAVQWECDDSRGVKAMKAVLVPCFIKDQGLYPVPCLWEFPSIRHGVLFAHDNRFLFW